MDMNRTFFKRKEDVKSKWRVFDAKGQIVGRLATQIAITLRGKHYAQYTPHTDTGDYVIVINAKDLVFTGNKMKDKVYDSYSGYIGNMKSLKAFEIMERDPAKIIELAVKRMMPRSKMSNGLLKKLRVYAGAEHPHAGQIAGLKAE